MTSTRQPRPALQRFSRTMFHGSINFEQQKKRAKELLKALKLSQPEAVDRLDERTQQLHLKDGFSSFKLADSQLVIAREAGFPSWPKLKAHCERLTLRKQQITSGHVPTLDSANTLHIRCGSDIKHGLEVAGFRGKFHEFNDPFCQGPVPKLPIEEFHQIRANFISTAYGIPLAEIQKNQGIAYAQLEKLDQFEHIVLWFEHDSYDQLILAYLLSHLSQLSNGLNLDLICVDNVPGVPDFVGLGQLAPEMLIWLWENERNPVTKQQLKLGKQVWNGLTATSIEPLTHIIETETPALPLMSKALERHLLELPAENNGLGLTQELTLDILSESGPIKGKKLFSILMREREPLPFLGDLMYWHELVKLSHPDAKLIDYKKVSDPTAWPEREIFITEMGHKVLQGQVDYLTLNPPARWVGGIEISNKTEAIRRT